MKVVLLHDWLTGFRGGERVFEAFCEMFPEAPIYTLIHSPGTTSTVIEKHEITSSFLNKIPNIHNNYRKFLPLFPTAAKSLHIKENADLVLSSSHCVIKGVTRPKGSKHISYIHSPMRYIYDQFENYFGENSPKHIKMAAKLIRPYLTKWDKKSNQNVDLMIANSNFVKQRIKKYYNIEAQIVHPFVDLADFNNIDMQNSDDEDYYLMVTAFAPNKRVDLAIRAFNKIGKTLKIIGSGQDENYLRQIANSNIQFLGNLSRSVVISHMAKAKGFIFPGVEDFGITPLESLAAGTPVIAYKIGGVLETLNESVAQFFDKDQEECLIEAIINFENRTFDKNRLVERSHEFSKEKFKNNIQNAINQIIK